MKRFITIAMLILCFAFISSSTVIFNQTRAASGGSSTVSQALSDEFPTEQGPVRGEIVGNTIVFRGIPYAAAPVGDLRWRSPQTAEKRNETLDAVNFGNICPQFDRNGSVVGNEDCLFLN